MNNPATLRFLSCDQLKCLLLKCYLVTSDSYLVTSDSYLVTSDSYLVTSDRAASNVPRFYSPVPPFPPFFRRILNGLSNSDPICFGHNFLKCVFDRVV
jgi:hypothetical protein